MYVAIEILGHVFKIEFSVRAEEDYDGDGIGGGSGGYFERCVEPTLDFFEGEHWEEWLSLIHI